MAKSKAKSKAQVANVSPEIAAEKKEKVVKKMGGRSLGMSPTGDHATKERSIKPHLRSAGFGAK